MRKLAAFLWLGLALVARAVDNEIPKHAPFTAGANDRNITRLVSQMLERFHYRQQTFDDQVSSRFLDRYLNTLDPFHLHFLQTDLAEFEIFRTKLDDQTKLRGDSSPAYVIANRFIERIEQRMAYCQDLLKNEKFEFTDRERVVLDRKDEPYPKDLDEAKKLWRQRLRAEVLQEVLGQIKPANTVASLGAQTPKPALQLPDQIPAIVLSNQNLSRPALAAAAASTAATNKVESPAEVISRRYNRVLRLYREWDNEDVLEVYLTSLAHVYDPHSDYLGKSQYDSFAINMSLSLFGIGARLTSDDGYCTIEGLTDGGPALRSGKLKPKDRIVAVAQGDGEPVDVEDTKLSKVVELIRGPKGTEVRLTVIPVDAPDKSTRKVISLVREEIKLEDQEATSKLMELPGPDGQPLRLGVIDLPSFYFTIRNEDNAAPAKSCSADVARLLHKLVEEKVRGVILDLRRNGGGSLEEAVKLTGLFIKQGPVVQVRNYDGSSDVLEDKDESVAYDGPLIVLTSHFSASASEILAAALQDYGRAVIVGDAQTHGKGTVQSLNPLKPYLEQRGIELTNDPGHLKITIRKFYRDNGDTTQLKGVTPDIVLPSVVDAVDVGEASLDDPLAPGELLKPADYKPLDLVKPLLPELRTRSMARLAAEKDWAYIREDYGIMKKNRADKTVSLNLAERLKEKDETEARQKVRDAERLARKPVTETDWKLTVKLSDQPGLPDRIGVTNGNKVTYTFVGTNAASIIAAETFKATLAGASVSTNAASVVVAASLAATQVIKSDDESVSPQIDVPLEEAKKVLLDYLQLTVTKTGGMAQSEGKP